MASRKMVRFNGRWDILLLREVRAVNPYGDAQLWIEIAENLSSLEEFSDGATPRRCRERTALLLEYFKDEDHDSLKRYYFTSFKGALHVFCITNL